MPYSLTRYDARSGLPTPISREVERISNNALVRAHKIDSVRFVSRFAMAAIADITAAEEQVAKVSPSAAVRAMAIGDTATNVIAGIILGMTLD